MPTKTVPTVRPSSSTAQIPSPAVARPSGRTAATSRSTFAVRVLARHADVRDQAARVLAPGARRPSPRTRPPGAAGARSRRPAPRARRGPRAAARRSRDARSRRRGAAWRAAGARTRRRPRAAAARRGRPRATTTGQRDVRADRWRGSSAIIARPATFVSVCRACAESSPCVARGVSATGSETNHGRKTARRYQTRSA